MIGIDTQNIAGIGSPQILFFQNPHGGFELSFGASPITWVPMYPLFTFGQRWIGELTPLIPSNYPGRN